MSASSSGSGADLFPEMPVPLVVDYALPSFPVDALPASLRSMVSAVTEATQTDIGMAATTALSAVAGAVGGRVEVDVRPGWWEGTNVYTVVVAGPGERKSAVQRYLTKPLYEAERLVAERMGPEISEQRTRKQVLDKAAEKSQERAAKPGVVDRDAAMAEAIAAARAAELCVVPASPRLIADDSTPEALASLLVQQGGRVSVVSAEPGVFDMLAGRFSKVPALDVYLKGHAGDPIRIDRVGRSPEFVSRPALSMGLMLQPHVLGTLVTNRAYLGRGLLARFLFCMPPSRLGERDVRAAPVPGRIEQAYSDFLTDLALAFFDQKEPATLQLTEGALEALLDASQDIENDMAAGGPLASIREWGAKLAGAVCRIAGLLHVAELGRRAPDSAISRPTMAAALRIGRYYRDHAIAAFDARLNDPVTVDAAYVLDVIKQKGEPQVTRRDIHRAASRSRFPSADDLDPALRRLCEFGYVALMQEDKVGRRGRPAGPAYHVHPKLYDA